MSKPLPRIVSLLPSATEIVCALDLRESLVGVSHECDHPADVLGLPVVTTARIDSAGSSRAIDHDIRGLVENGLGVFRIDVERLAALEPDLIVTQDQCEVCAVPYAEVVRATRDLAGRHVEIVSLQPQRLGDVWAGIERVAVAAGQPRRGREVAAALRERIAAIAARTSGLDRPRLACLDWLDPLMAAGHWVPDLAAVAGAVYELVEPGEPSVRLEWERLAAARPDVLVAAPCGLRLERAWSELGALLAAPHWRAFPAVQVSRVFAVDGSAYLNRPGPRLVESAAILAGLAHPERLGQLVPEGASQRVAVAAHLAAGAGGG